MSFESVHSVGGFIPSQPSAALIHKPQAAHPWSGEEEDYTQEADTVENLEHRHVWTEKTDSSALTRNQTEDKIGFPL